MSVVNVVRTIAFPTPLEGRAQCFCELFSPDALLRQATAEDEGVVDARPEKNGQRDEMEEGEADAEQCCGPRRSRRMRSQGS